MAKETKRIDKLAAAATEMQKVLNFDPPMKIKGKSEKDLEKLLKDGAEQIEEGDEFSEETIAVLVSLGVEFATEEAEEEEAEEEAEEEEEQEEEEEEEEEEKPAKKAAAKKSAPAEKKEPGTKLSTVEKKEYFTPLIKSGKYTTKELVTMALKKFPGLSESSIRTFLVDSKNPKYNKLDKLVVADDEGRLSFEK